MPRVGKTNEKRAERRLRYRWPVRFARSTEEKPFAGQMADLSSKGMAFLFHADQSCPHPDQLIRTNFGVPHFDSRGSFDTVFFNRTGRVCRVDNLSSQVNRVAIQFAEPLFFKPGEQDISDSDAQQRLAAKARSVVESKATAGTGGKASAEAPKRATAKTARRVRAGKKPQAKADRRPQAQTKAHEKLRSYAAQIAKVKAEAAREIARVTAEASEAIARIEAECRATAVAPDQAGGRDDQQKNAGNDAGLSEKPDLMKKVDAFFTDRNRIF